MGIHPSRLVYIFCYSYENNLGDRGRDLGEGSSQFIDISTIILEFQRISTREFNYGHQSELIGLERDRNDSLRTY